MSKAPGPQLLLLGLRTSGTLHQDAAAMSIEPPTCARQDPRASCCRSQQCLLYCCPVFRHCITVMAACLAGTTTQQHVRYTKDGLEFSREKSCNEWPIITQTLTRPRRMVILMYLGPALLRIARGMSQCSSTVPGTRLWWEDAVPANAP